MLWSGLGIKNNLVGESKASNFGFKYLFLWLQAQLENVPRSS